MKNRRCRHSRRDPIRLDRIIIIIIVIKHLLLNYVFDDAVYYWNWGSALRFLICSKITFEASSSLLSLFCNLNSVLYAKYRDSVAAGAHLFTLAANGTLD